LTSESVPQVQDDLIANVLTLEERYRIADLFEKRDENKRAFVVIADPLPQFLSTPSTPVRTTPLAVSHPNNIAVQIEVHQ
jgi:hypothetical protein